MKRGGLVIILLICIPLFNAQVYKSPIKHFFILMMENRSFDHMLGHLKQINPNIRGLNGNERNPLFPLTKSDYVTVSFDAPDRSEDPGHHIEDTEEQIYNVLNGSINRFPTMNGFIANARRVISHEWAPNIMRNFNYKTLPVLSTLANEFALFDMWFSSVAGPTQPNRMYLHSCTSAGLGHNDKIKMVQGLPQKSIYQNIQESGHTWRIYFEDFTEALILKQMRNPSFVKNYKWMNTFESDVMKGDVPTVSMIHPRYFSALGIPATDQHPDHSVAEGEKFIKHVYETIRNSPIWEKSALVVLYDEHGGFYDHMIPPTNGIPSPDGLNSTNPHHDFRRLGIRTPTIVISPWVNRLVVHEPIGPTSTSHYDHTSVHATLKRMFGLKNFLTKRDAWAGTFDHLFLQRSKPRTDCPSKLPPAYEGQRHLTSAAEDLLPLNSLQESFIIVAEGAVGIEESKVSYIRTQQEGSDYIRSLMDKFLNQQ